MSGNVDDVNAPRSLQNIVKDVMEFVESHVPDGGSHPEGFDVYDQALHAVWPGLYKADKKAAILVAISIWIEAGERWGFEVKPEEIKELRL